MLFKIKVFEGEADGKEGDGEVGGDDIKTRGNSFIVGIENGDTVFAQAAEGVGGLFIGQLTAVFYP